MISKPPIVSALPTDHICPVSGLPIVRKSAWTAVTLGDNYQVSFSLLGDHIVLSQKSGYGTPAATDNFFTLMQEVRSARKTANKNFVLIEDYTRFKGATFEARKRYIARIKDQPIDALIIFGASPFFKMSFKLGKRLYAPRKTLVLVNSYPQAVRRALQELSTNPAPSVKLPSRRDGRLKESTRDTCRDQLSKHTTTTRPDWQLDLAGFTTRFEVIDRNMLHSVSSGYLQIEHVAPIESLRDKVRREMGLSDGFVCIIAGVEKMEGASPRARKGYIDSLMHWHARYPCQLYIFYGVNRFIRAAFNLARPILPFSGHIAKDYKDALKIALAELTQRPIPPAESDDGGDTGAEQHLNSTQGHVDELLRYLGGIDWQREGIEFNREVTDSHPFRPVFDAIALIKGELEDLLMERDKALEALKKSEEKYRTILQSIQEGYFEVDLEGNFIFFNDVLCHIFGYTSDELVGMNYHEIMDEKNAQRIHRIFTMILQTGVSKKRVDWKVIRKNGTAAIVETSISMIRDSKAQATGFRGIARDLTEQKRVEAEKKRLEAKLQQAQKMEAIGTLAGGVAHDLNNILSGIVSYPELLLMDIPENSPLRAPLTTVKQSGEKAATIVQDLLTLARRGVSISEIANLNHILAEYLASPEFEKLQFYHPDIDIETRYDEKLLNIMCSPVHLSKTVMNLISNAAEAMTAGGKIILATENRYIDQPISGYDDVEQGDYAVLTVSDAGIGISPADQKRIFEPFYTKKVMGRSGTGLGMAVVWGTVKDHKGYIDVESTEGQGTTFTLYFPAVRAKLAPSQLETSFEDFKGKGESVLVVDDVKEQRDLATLMLKKLGYTVTTVSSGDEAVAFLKENSVDLLVLDMIMDPGIDGLETYRRILEIRPGQKAIIASGFSESERVKEAQRAGAGVYVKKPYLLEKIGTAVRAELDRRPNDSGPTTV